jgi:phosphoglycerol transferase MdoB-like AlkP superfamily enzyme
VLAAIFWLPRFDLIFKMGWGRSVFQPTTWLHLILFDMTVLGYFLAPWLVLSLLPLKRRRGTKWIFLSYLTFAIFLALFACIAEFFFIDEFSSRYNFIAVDYLVYTSEVLKNIWESYPIISITLAVALTSFTIAWALNRTPRRLSTMAKLAALVVFAALFVFVNEESQLSALSESQKEVAKNSFHALFAAFRNNQIDYEKFYPTLPDTKAFEVTHQEMQKDFSQEQIAKDSVEDARSVIRNLEEPSKAAKKWNVMFVLMESMSAKYMRAYGGQGLTPNLDRLFVEGLTFDHVYSTGTRTVRGIEAVMLSLPPTPGQSIVRRPHSDHIFSIGSVLKDQGYDLAFLYGGHALFDNMGEFFEANYFSVSDQGDFASQDVHFSNAWGICDEDVFDLAVKRAGEVQKTGKPFFQFILTTSNHRPYTFPENRIDMASGSGREAAVKYSDYAIGHFLDEAKKQSWFDHTLFVFVADHNAAVAGGTNILPSDYRIPFIVYAPKLIPKQKISLLGSQIDVAPTLLGLLGISYQSRFYGHDLMTARNQRTFLGTYQQLAYMENDRMMILEPPKKWAEFKLEGEKPTKIRSGTDFNDADELLKKTVGYYQSASDSFRHRLIGLEKQYPASLNVRVFKKADL